MLVYSCYVSLSLETVYRGGNGSDWRVAFSCLPSSCRYWANRRRRENATFQSLPFPSVYTCTSEIGNESFFIFTALQYMMRPSIPIDLLQWDIWFPETCTLTENKFSRETYFYTVASWQNVDGGLDSFIAIAGKTWKRKAPLGFQKNRTICTSHSGQTETVSVRFRPKILACFGFSFGISVFSFFGVSAEALLSAKWPHILV